MRLSVVPIILSDHALKRKASLLADSNQLFWRKPDHIVSNTLKNYLFVILLGSDMNARSQNFYKSD